MSKAQRIAVAVYCLLVAYCCLWVPWRVSFPEGAQYRAGYGLLWIGPLNAHLDPFATRPDFPIIALRIIAVSFISAVVFLALVLGPRE